MKIISATQNDLHSIATLMVKKYQRLNDYLGYNMYKTDYDLFLRVWSERMVYFEDSSQLIFINKNEKF